MKHRIVKRMSQWRFRRSIGSKLTEPLVSFAFDDFPKSAAEAGREILERHGVRGTYFCTSGFCDKTLDGIRYFSKKDVKDLHTAGHEIGAHSARHNDLPTLSNSEIMSEFEDNAAFIDSILPDYHMTSFAYPSGEVSPRVKRLAANQYPICRGVWEGINHGQIDGGLLKMMYLENRHTSKYNLTEWIDRAKANSAWMVFTTHDVSSSPSPYGVTPSRLEETVKTVLDAGLKILPIKNAAGLCMHGTA